MNALKSRIRTVHAVASCNIFIVPCFDDIPPVILVSRGKPFSKGHRMLAIETSHILLLHDYAVQPDGTGKRHPYVTLVLGDEEMPVAPGPAKTLSRLLHIDIVEVA